MPIVNMEDRTLQFGSDFYKAAVAQFGDTNLFFSPFSLSVALAMLHAGASGDTAAQLAKTLYLDTSGDPNAAYRDVLNELKAANSDKQIIRVVDTLWLEKTYKVEEAYTKVLKDQFAATVKEADFITDPDKQRLAINSDVETATGGMIKDLLAPADVDALVRLILTNAIYFQGTWKSQFDIKNTKQSVDFNVAADRKVKVAMMQQKLIVPYFENEHVRGIEVPYGPNGDFVMMILLPNGTNTLQQVEAKFDPIAMNEWWAKGTMESVDLQLPKFKAGGDVAALKVLQAMGLSDLFDSGKAKLTGINGNNELFVSQLAHQARVDVDEVGTKAAAASGAVVSYRSAPTAPKDFNVNKPFMFAIIKKGAENAQGDRSFGHLLFFGRVTDPTAP